MSRLTQVLLKALVALAFCCLFVGAFVLGLAYTMYGWSTIIAWRNGSSCSILSSYPERRSDSGVGRVVFEVSSPGEGVFRAAAVLSMNDAVFLRFANNAELAAQSAAYAARANVLCYIPPIRIPFSQSSGVLGQLAYYRVNSARNFILLDYLQTDLNLDIARWQSLMIAGAVLMGVACLLGLLLLAWWALCLESEVVRARPSKDATRASWYGRMPK